MGVLVAVNAFSARRHEREAVRQEAYRVTLLVAATQERLSETADGLLAALAELPVTPDVPSRCAARLALILARAERFQNLGFVSPDGRVACAARAVRSEPPVGLRLIRPTGLNHELAVSGYEQTPLAPKPTILFTRGRGPTGDAGTVFAALDLEWLSGIVEGVPLPAGGAVNVLDQTGRILARHPEHEDWVGRDVSQAPIVALTLAQPSGVLETAGVDGVVRLYGHHRVDLTPTRALFVTVGLPLQGAYAESNRRLRHNLIILIATALVSVVAARLLSDRLLTRRVEGVLRAARRLSAGDLSARTGERFHRDEVGELARAFDAMAWTLEQRAAEMEEMNESLRGLATRVEAVREDERTSISREIHDELGQALTGVKMDLDRMTERLVRTPMPDDDRSALQTKIESARGLVISSLDTSRRISRQLRPSVLDVLGLQAGIEWQLEEFRERTGIATSLLADDVSDLDETRSVVLFRILQEALTNVTRHAAATNVRVRLVRTETGVVLEVTDDGRGFLASDRPSPRSLGLLGMRERAASLGGKATIRSNPGKGTVVEVRLPFASGAGAP